MYSRSARRISLKSIELQKKHVRQNANIINNHPPSYRHSYSFYSYAHTYVEDSSMRIEKLCDDRFRGVSTKLYLLPVLTGV